MVPLGLIRGTIRGMRIVIVDSNLRAGRATAATVEEVLSSADVLLYADVDSAVAGVTTNDPDVVIVAPVVGELEGPDVVRRVAAADGRPKYVGVVAKPDASWSMRYVDAGARLVVSAPLSSLDVQMAMRHRAGGVPS
jgi:DNA-binding response OmpR family regulator